MDSPSAREAPAAAVREGALEAALLRDSLGSAAAWLLLAFAALARLRSASLRLFGEPRERPAIVRAIPFLYGNAEVVAPPDGLGEREPFPTRAWEMR